MNGIDPAATPRTNDANGNPYDQRSGALRVFPHNFDPKDEYPDVKRQVNQGSMTGFAQDFADSHPQALPEDIQQVMCYFSAGDLPALHTLARHFTVCDNWFASVPGPTWANRLFAHSGTSLGHLSMPDGLFNLHLHWYSQDTIYDRLNAYGKQWKIYYGDVPQSLLLVHQLLPKNAIRYHRLPTLFEDTATTQPDTFPPFVFIEPEYYPPGANDDHPPHDVLNGDHLIADVYNALRKNEKLFAETLLVIVWDEHGGFYDHAPPQSCEPPDSRAGEFGFDFKTLGVRVPALLVSPWTAQTVNHTAFDHTSILRFVVETMGLLPLGNRVATTNSIGQALLTKVRPMSGLPDPIHDLSPLEAPPPAATDTLNANQHGLVAYSQYLATQTPEDPTKTNERNAFMMTSARAQIDIAYDHVDRFLEHTKSTTTVPTSPPEPNPPATPQPTTTPKPG